MKKFKVEVFFNDGFGFFDNTRVRSGDILEVTEKQFCGKWMKKIEERKKPGPKPKKETPAETPLD